MRIPRDRGLPILERALGAIVSAFLVGGATVIVLRWLGWVG